MTILKKIFDKKLQIQSKIKEKREELAASEFKNIFYLFKNFCNFDLTTKINKTKKIKVLDFGCGDQYLKKEFANNFFEYYGVDINDANFENEKINFKDNFFDIIISLAVLEHLKNPKIYIEEIKRLLKADGLLYLVTPNWSLSSRNFYDDPTHVSPYTPKSLERLFNFYDFKNVQTLPGTRNKPIWYYTGRGRFLKSFYLLPFRNDNKLKFIPKFLKGKSSSIILLANK